MCYTVMVPLLLNTTSQHRPHADNVQTDYIFIMHIRTYNKTSISANADEMRDAASRKNQQYYTTRQVKSPGSNAASDI